MAATLIVKGTNDKPAASQALVDFFAVRELGGCLFVGFPIIGSADGRKPIDALWLSQQHGAIVFDLVEGAALQGMGSRQDDAANKLESRLRAHSELVERRLLVVLVTTVTYAPALDGEGAAEAGYALATSATLAGVLEGLPTWAMATPDRYRAALSAIQNISTIRKPRAHRLISRPDSRGARLKRLEESIATLDNIQGRAVVETVDGVQRIRGLAGSGKTIVLALKAAYLHAQHPDWKIGVTFYTRSLKNQFRRHITNFMLASTGDEPDWDQLKILNAWGAPGGGERTGVYYEFTSAHGMEYFDYRAAKNKFGQDKEFEGVCELAIAQVKEARALYDVLLVDEAQDFPPSFLRICLQSLDSHQRLV